MKSPKIKSAGKIESPSHSNYHALLAQLFQVVQLNDHAREQRLLEGIPDYKLAKQLRASLNGIIAEAELSSINNALSRLSAPAAQNTNENNESPPCPAVIDVAQRCRYAPYRVPAKPWTTVTDSDDVVSHLVSLYLTWGYPFYAFFCRETFLKHMRLQNLHSDFCSPFLVNALLANACFFSDYLEAHKIPGDLKKMGAKFLAEAELHLSSRQLESGADIRLSSIQAFLLLYERYSLSGYDDYGYIMLNRAISMAKSIGVINSFQKLRLDTSQFNEDMERSLKRTAWGLFQIDTITHTNFLKESLIDTVNLDRIPRDETDPDSVWTPYPLDAARRRSHMSVYFDEACKLSAIAAGISREFNAPNKGHDHYHDRTKQRMYACLSKWEKNLSSIFELDQESVPYIVILRMRYHTLIINLSCYDIQANISSFNINAQTHHLNTSNSDSAAMKTAISSARSISNLVQIFKAQYGLKHAHQFTMYAINVSLFCLLTQADLDLFDPDFLSLTEAFSIVACRSPVGRHLFHVFKLTVRRIVAGNRNLYKDFPGVLGELFGARENQNHAPDRWDLNAEAFSEASGEGSFLDAIQTDRSVGSLNEMIDWYERLSVGREIRWTRDDRLFSF